IFDVSEVANEKVHMQATADASAHSQSSVMARTMNMLAFANVGKRIDIGYITAYESSIAWMQWLVGAGWALTALCGLAAIAFPPIGGVCPRLAQMMTAGTCIYALEEALD